MNFFKILSSPLKLSYITYCLSSIIFTLHIILDIVHNLHIILSHYPHTFDSLQSPLNHFKLVCAALYCFVHLHITLHIFALVSLPFWSVSVIFSTTSQPSSDLCYTTHCHFCGFCLGFQVEHHHWVVWAVCADPSPDPSPNPSPNPVTCLCHPFLYSTLAHPVAWRTHQWALCKFIEQLLPHCKTSPPCNCRHPVWHCPWVSHMLHIFYDTLHFLFAIIAYTFYRSSFRIVCHVQCYCLQNGCLGGFTEIVGKCR